jgi:hypothetical protein
MFGFFCCALSCSDVINMHRQISQSTRNLLIYSPLTCRQTAGVS